MKGIGTRFVVPLGILALLFSAFMFYRTHAASRRHAKELMSRQAALALEFNLAIRTYVGAQIRPAMEKLVGRDGFVPEAMSTSLVSRNIFEEVRKKFPEYVVRFASENPRNPINRATPDDIKMIKYFREHPQADLWSGEVTLDGNSYLTYRCPRRITQGCLRCHGDPKDAPAALLQRYGTQASFHKAVGDVAGLDTVAVPMDAVNAALDDEMVRQSVILITGLALLFAAIVLVFRIVVTRRLAAMARHCRQIAENPEGSRLPPIDIRGDDEIGVLAGAFNTLLDQVRVTHASLEQRVAERTNELAVVNDELKHEIAERTRMQEAAEAASRTKSEFLANMSHEIRTPMTAILGFSDALLDATLPQSERTDAIQTIRRNGEHLLQIINDILDLSKIEASKLQIERLRCSPCRIVSDVVSLMRVRADAKDIRLDVEYVGPMPETIDTDPTRLRQVLINLIGNAIKFTNYGRVRLATQLVQVSPTPEPETGKAAPEPRLQFDVIDTGIGMTPSQIEQIFEPFTQGDASTTRMFGGTGLGLVISKRLAEMLGGGIAVESTPGKGSTFRVTIATGTLDDVAMLVNPSEAMLLGRPNAHGDTQDEQRLPDVRILLAEDGADNQRLISWVLRKAGADVTVVENGRLAVDEVLAARDAGRPFDVILMDMQMPILDGYTATGILRRSGYTGTVIALTANAMANDRAECLSAGCDDYAAKPIGRKALLATIAGHLRHTSAPA